MRRGAAACLLLLVLGAGPGAAQGVPRFAVRAAAASDGWRPLVEAERLLADPALHRALDSGLPLRFRLRVELWEKRLIDRLVDAQELFVAVVEDPLGYGYEVDTGRSRRTVPTLAHAQAALTAALRPALRPSGAGRLYYLATLEVETLSLSDLEELRRWLRGEVQPAVQGRAPAERAVASGIERVLVRVIGLPTRRYEARSGTFRIAPGQ